MSLSEKTSKSSLKQSNSVKSTTEGRATVASLKFNDVVSNAGSKHSDVTNLYGGCVGADSVYVKLVASDDHEFIIERRYAEVSGRIKRILRNIRRHVDDDQPNEMHFPQTQSHIMEKLCEYFLFKVYYTYSSNEIPEFPIPFEIALQLLMSANFFDC